MKKLDEIKDIKLKALYIEKRFMSNRPEKMDAAEAELEALRNQSCDENRDFITPPMARVLKREFNTFMALIDWAHQHYDKKDS
jgi:hypothetical protein